MRSIADCSRCASASTNCDANSKSRISDIIWVSFGNGLDVGALDHALSDLGRLVRVARGLSAVEQAAAFRLELLQVVELDHLQLADVAAVGADGAVAARL